MSMSFCSAFRKFRRRSKTSIKSRSPFYQQIWVWILVLISGIWLVGSIIFAFALSSPDSVLSTYVVPNGFSRGIVVLKVLVDGVGIALALLVSSTLNLVSWTSIRRHCGSFFPTLLALSPNTGVLGMLQLLKWKSAQKRKGCSVVFRGWHVFWIVVRYRQNLSGSYERLGIQSMTLAAGIIILGRMAHIRWTKLQVPSRPLRSISPVAAHSKYI